MRLFVAASPPLRDRHALGVHSEFNRWFSLASLTVRPWFARGSITLEWVLTLPRSAASFLTASSRLSRQFLDSSSGVLFYCSPSVQSDNLQPHNAHLHLFAACSSLFPRCSSWATRKPTNQRRKTPRENNSLRASQHRRSRSVPEVPSFLGTPIFFFGTSRSCRYMVGWTREPLYGLFAHTLPAHQDTDRKTRKGAAPLVVTCKRENHERRSEVFLTARSFCGKGGAAAGCPAPCSAFLCALLCGFAAAFPSLCTSCGRKGFLGLLGAFLRV